MNKINKYLLTGIIALGMTCGAIKLKITAQALHIMEMIRYFLTPLPQDHRNLT